MLHTIVHCKVYIMSQANVTYNGTLQGTDNEPG